MKKYSLFNFTFPTLLIVFILLFGCEVNHNATYNGRDLGMSYKQTDLSPMMISSNTTQKTLLAGKHTEAGTLYISNDADFIYVTYQLSENWVLTETHLAIANALNGIPQTSKGNPIPGKFPCKQEYRAPTSAASFQIPLDENGFSAGDTVYVAAHAEVRLMPAVEAVKEESAWADGEGFPGKNWATFFTFTLTSVEMKPVLDAFIANYGAADEVWFNDGSGIYYDSAQRLDPRAAYCVDVGDLDGDGDLDAFIANYEGQPETVWFNDGTGIFTDGGQELGAYNTVGVDLGDVDGDGDLDAFIVNAFAEPNLVWLNVGDGTFFDSQQRMGNVYSLAVDLADLDGDGDLDAFVSNAGPNEVWMNDGNGFFTNSGQSIGSGYSHNTALGDLDGDGDLDAFTANYISEADEVWLNDGLGVFSDSFQRLGDASGLDVELGDIDGDGDLDAFVANQGAPYTPGPDEVWLNNGDGRFVDSDQKLGYSTGWSVELKDVDRDGDLDAFVANTEENTLWLNDGLGIFSDSGQLFGAVQSRGVALGEFR